MSVIHSILTQPWMLSHDFLATNAYHVARLIKGEPNAFQVTDNDDTSPLAILFNPVTGVEVDMADSRRASSSSDEKYVAIFRLRGVLTKADQECGPRGLETLNRRINQAANDDNIIAGVFDMDSPGGEATNIHTVATSVKNFGKPFLTSFNGLCCSAAYYLASATDKIYAQEKTDIAGSIGVMVSIMDLKGFFEQQGVKIHEVFADQSSKKNSNFLQAMEGNYEPLKKRLLNPYAQDFIDFVKASRNISDDDAFAGETYMSKESKKIGMIDGIKTLGATLEEAYKLGMKEWKQKNRKSNSSRMKSDNVLKAAANKLGFQALEAKEGYVSLSVEQLDKLMAQEGETIEGETLEVKADEGTIAKINALEKTVAALEKRVGANEKAIETNEKDIKAFGDDTTEEPTSGNATEDPANANVNTDGEPKVLTEEEKYGKYYQ